MNGLINYTFGVLTTQLSKKKRAYFNHHLLQNENLWSLYKRMIDLNEEDALQRNDINLPFDLNFDVYAILDKYGVPYCIKKMIINGAAHTILVYKKKMIGTRTRVVYHFLNGNLIHVNFRFRIIDVQQSERIKKHLATIFKLNQSQLNDTLEISDEGTCYIELESYQDIKVSIYHELNESRESLKQLFDKHATRMPTQSSKKEKELVF